MAGCYAENLVADRVEFWNDIYGKKSSAHALVWSYEVMQASK